MDMRSGAEKILARVVTVFGAVQPHHGYLFANRSGTRLKILVHDGIGVWLAARRLYRGGFHWPNLDNDDALPMTREQLDALILGLPWQQMGSGAVIRRL